MMSPVLQDGLVDGVPAVARSPRVDIGFRCPVTQSSEDSPGFGASRLYPSVSPGGFFFHTALEANPWVIVDLGQTRTIGEIVLWNREDHALLVQERAVPLTISASDDGLSWRDVSIWHMPFGGRLSFKPLRFEYYSGLVARFIRVTASKTTYLHFDYIEILQFVPKLQFGFATNLRFDAGRNLICDYVHFANNGLYSGYSTAAEDVAILAHAGIFVSRLDLSMSFKFFKDDPDHDAYPDYFAASDGDVMPNLRQVAFSCGYVHYRYKDLDLHGLQHLAMALFSPSQTVLRLAEDMVAATRLDTERTIALVYRGTDKGTELTLAPIEKYIELALRLKQRHPESAILIQTDQEQARDAVRAAFGADCVWFKDLPVTSGSTAIHNLPFGEAVRMGRADFTRHMMAAIINIARCRFVITHTGNVGAWLAFYRGSAARLYQFDVSGELVLPADDENS